MLYYISVKGKEKWIVYYLMKFYLACQIRCNKPTGLQITSNWKGHKGLE